MASESTSVAAGHRTNSIGASARYYFLLSELFACIGAMGVLGDDQWQSELDNEFHLGNRR